MNKKRKLTPAELISDPDRSDGDREDNYDNMGMFSGMDTTTDDNKGKKKVPLGYETVTKRYASREPCPLCEQGFFTYGNSPTTMGLASLMKNTVLYISREEVVKQLKSILDAHIDFQQSEMAKGVTIEKPDREVSEEEIMRHLSEHMTEYTWELRTQIDEQRALIKILKDKLVEVDPDTGTEYVHEKNVKLFLSAEANLRKIFATEVHKSLSYNPNLAYNKAEVAQKE